MYQCPEMTCINSLKNKHQQNSLKNKANLWSLISIKETEFVLKTLQQIKLYTMIASLENCTEDCTKNLNNKQYELSIISSKTLLNSLCETRKSLIIKPDKGIIIEEKDRISSMNIDQKKNKY